MNKIKVVYLILFCAIIIYYGFALNNHIGLSGDDAGYIIWAKSILQGGGLDYINEPQPRNSGYKLYVLPILIAPIVYFTDNLFFIKFIPLIFSALAVLVFLYFACEYLNDRKLIVFSVLLFIYNGLFFDYSNQIMAENIFIFFSLISVIFAEKYLESDKLLNRYFFLTAIFSVLAYLTRTAGAALIIAIIFYFFIKFEIKKTLCLIIAFIVLLALIYYPDLRKKNQSETYINIIKMKSQYSPESGARSAADILKDSARKTAVYSLRLIPDTFFYPYFKNIKPSFHKKKFAIQALTGAILSGIILIGFLSKTQIYKIMQLRKNIIANINLFDVYVFITILMLLVWQIYSSRYLLPILQFLIIYFVLGLDKITNNNIRYFKIIISLLIILGFCGQMYLIYNNRNFKLPKEWADYYAALDYIMQTENGGDLKNINVTCRKPLSYHLKSGYKIKTIGYPLTKDLNAIDDFMMKNNINYIVRDNFAISGPHTAEIYLDNYLEHYSERLKLVFASDDNNTRLYKLVR